MKPRIPLAIAFATFGTMALAQGTEIAFGEGRPDSALPVEVTADSLRVDQNNGTAMFTGSVLVGQGEMRLSADQVEVRYLMKDGNSTGEVAQVLATGNVTFVNGSEAAEGDVADYDVPNGTMLLTGDVILTQGRNVLSGQKLVVNMDDGTGIMEGRVKSILQTGGN